MNNSDFLTVIAVPEHVNEKIRAFKSACVKHIGKFPGMHAEAHISIEIITDKVDQVTRKPLLLTPFYEMVSFKIKTIPRHDLKIRGFDFFTHGSNFRTIYAAIELDKKTGEWFDNIKTALRMRSRRLNPHITIAGRVSTETFNILWPRFQKLEYNDTFEADCLTILEKESDNKHDRYKVHKKIPFGKKAALSHAGFN